MDALVFNIPDWTINVAKSPRLIDFTKQPFSLVLALKLGPRLQSLRTCYWNIQVLTSLVSLVNVKASLLVDFPSAAVMKKSASQCRRSGFFSWVGKMPWRRKRQPTPVFLPGKSHGQKSPESYSPWGCKDSDMTLATKQRQSLQVKLNSGLWLPLEWICLLNPLSGIQRFQVSAEN